LAHFGGGLFHRLLSIQHIKPDKMKAKNFGGIFSRVLGGIKIEGMGRQKNDCSPSR
jgi:hypothetical protein